MIVRFRHDLIFSLANADEAESRRSASVLPARPLNVSVHLLEECTEKDESNRQKKKRCCKCYDEMKQNVTREETSKKAQRVSTFCKDCDVQFVHCLASFAKYH